MEKEFDLISPQQLQTELANDRLRVFDATAYLDPRPDGKPGYLPRNGRPNWQAEHIRGSQHVDLTADFSAANARFPFTMLTSEQFCARMSSLGVSDDSLVVIYSSGSVMWATRIWWMFRSVGFKSCAVLDGGLEKWKAEGYPTTTETKKFAEGKLTVPATSTGWATKAEIAALLTAGENTCLIDSLSARDYSGEKSHYGGKGHIPGSHNVFYHALVKDGAFLPVEKLREYFLPSKALKKDRVICYCGGGIASTMVAMALHLCGHRNIAVYDGSMLEWASDKTLPLKKGARP